MWWEHRPGFDFSRVAKLIFILEGVFQSRKLSLSRVNWKRTRILELGRRGGEGRTSSNSLASGSETEGVEWRMAIAGGRGSGQTSTLGFVCREPVKNPRLLPWSQPHLPASPCSPLVLILMLLGLILALVSAFPPPPTTPRAPEGGFLSGPSSCSLLYTLCVPSVIVDNTLLSAGG